YPRPCAAQVALQSAPSTPRNQQKPPVVAAHAAGGTVVVVVVVVVGVSRAATNAPTQELSMIPSTAAVLPSGGRQSFPDLFSSLSTQRFVGSLPPSNVVFALSRQPLKFGSFC